MPAAKQKFHGRFPLLLGCKLRHKSNVVAPVGSTVLVPNSTKEETCFKACTCTETGHFRSCIRLPCVKFSSCKMDGRLIGKKNGSMHSLYPGVSAKLLVNVVGFIRGNQLVSITYLLFDSVFVVANVTLLMGAAYHTSFLARLLWGAICSPLITRVLGQHLSLNQIDLYISTNRFVHFNEST